MSISYVQKSAKILVAQRQKFVSTVFLHDIVCVLYPFHGILIIGKVVEAQRYPCSSH